MRSQPPSGGCVLKLDYIKTNYFAMPPAAFGRLCVETNYKFVKRIIHIQPPSGGCVLKHHG